MNTVRRQEERRVAPIDAGQRPRVRPGGRREQPEIDEERDGRHGGHEDFADELARREQEEPHPFHPASAESPLVSGEDRVEIRGLAGPQPPATSEAEREPPRSEGRHLDLKA